MDDIEQETLAAAPPAPLGPDVPVCRQLVEQITFRDADPDAEEENARSGPGTMVGHFSMFDQWYEINSWFEGNFLERVAPGAFKRTFKNRSDQSPIRVLLEHGFDPTVGDKPLGVHSVLAEDERGAYAEVPLFDTSYNRDLAPALRAGAYGQSFRFQVLRDEWVEEPEPSDYNPKGIPERTIKEVRVIEHGPTVFPASPSTNETTGLRSTTDAFYERLRTRQPEQFAELVARSAAARLPKTLDAASVEDRKTPDADDDVEARKTEDPQPTEQRAEDSHEQERQDANPARHSEDAPVTEHSPTSPNPVQTQERTSTMDENMTVEERVARQSEIRSRMTEMDREFNGAALSEEARTEWDTLQREYDEHQTHIDDAERRRADLARIVPSEDNSERANPGRAPHVTRRPDNIYDLNAIRNSARSQEERVTMYRDNALRVVEAARFAGAADKAKAQESVERLLRTCDDDAATLARRVIATGSPLYDRAFGKAMVKQSTDLLSTEERAALSTADTAGGFAVPFDLDPTVILTSDGVINPLRAISRVETVAGNTWQGITSAGVTVSRSAEGSEVGDNGPTVAQPEVKLERVTGFIPFSMEIEQDWSRMRAEMTAMLADAKAEEEAGSFLNGDGNSPNPEGLLTAVTATVQVGTTNALGSSDLYALEEAVPPRFRARARFLAARRFYNIVRELGADNDGGNLWVRLGAGLPPELIGYPAHEASEMPAVALNVDTSVLAVLGDFSKFLIIDKAGMNVELVPHLMGASRRPTGQRGVLAVWRNNCKTLVPGAFRKLVGNDGV